MQGMGTMARVRRMWGQSRLRMGLAVCSTLVLATVLAIPVTRSADDEILLYPLPAANYGSQLRVTGSAPAGQAREHLVQQPAVLGGEQSDDPLVAVRVPQAAQLTPGAVAVDLDPLCIQGGQGDQELHGVPPGGAARYSIMGRSGCRCRERR